MSEKSTINTILNTEVPESVDHAFQNLTGDLTQNIGSTLSDIWYLVFGGLSHLAEKKKAKYAFSLEQFKEELSSSIKKIPPEKQMEPSFQVTAQALENAKYCATEKELRDMFTALISNSMNSDFSKDIHPSFAEIIKQMSVLDSKILKKFQSAPINGIPICHYRTSQPGKTGYITVLENVFVELPEISLELCSTSLSSLERLGLLQIPKGTYLDRPDYYNLFELHPWFNLLKKEFPDREVSIEKGVASLTPLGRSFARVCIPN